MLGNVLCIFCIIFYGTGSLILNAARSNLQKRHEKRILNAIERHLNKGESPNKPIPQLFPHDEDKNTPPLLRVIESDTCNSMVKELLEKGADPALCDKRKENAFFRAAAAGAYCNLQSIITHIKKKNPQQLPVALNTPNVCKLTPALIATRRGNFNCLRLLLNYGATANTDDKKFNTPLHFLAINPYRTNEQCIKKQIIALYKKGANINIKNKADLTADALIHSFSREQRYKGHIKVANFIVALRGADLAQKITRSNPTYYPGILPQDLHRSLHRFATERYIKERNISLREKDYTLLNEAVPLIPIKS